MEEKYKMEKATLAKLEALATEIRIDSIEAIRKVGAGHRRLPINC